MTLRHGKPSEAAGLEVLWFHPAMRGANPVSPCGNGQFLVVVDGFVNLLEKIMETGLAHDDHRGVVMKHNAVNGHAFQHDLAFTDETDDLKWFEPPLINELFCHKCKVYRTKPSE
jgi:hypothetical protein